jgi:sugar/nucleoside kinase (ribokinase family)
MAKVISVGFSCVDLYKGLNKYYPTGNGVDWGIHLSRMGIDVSVLSVVGTDVYGEDMKKVLSDEGIDVSHLRVENGDTCKMVMLMIKFLNIYTDTSVLYMDSPEESMERLFTIDMGPLWYERSLWKQIMFASNGL